MSDRHSLSALMILKLGSLFTLSDEETQALHDLPIQAIDLKSNRDIVRIGDSSLQCFLILEGYASSYKLTPDGQRQIMALHIPGDIPDLQSLYLKRMDCSIASLSPCTVGFFQVEELRRVCARHPRIAAAFWRDTLVDASILREWVVNVGRRDAYTRIAHLLCEFLVRLEAVGLVQGGTFDFPITQANLADATGISAVHMSRALKALRDNGLIQTRRRYLSVPDWQKLQEAGEFDPLYLHLEDNVAAGLLRTSQLETAAL
ncbi:Crp/Fnr family transcriptional regulator [Billgrantia lactosivorans]|uniref:Crp/Fnr family transcriptional regulator n=1 Tax=Billgrantia lactosivorans TaxID=2185141 RepID=UPI000DAD62BF|nr:Crp/Fnr family transcriptional regulator [Halomonas lactosivorans]